MKISNLYRIILAITNIITNLLILALALVVLIVGILGIVFVNTSLSASEFIIYINTLFILVILIGAFITLICLLGIIGSLAAYSSNNKLLKIVSICMLVFSVCGMVLVLIGEITGVVLAFNFRSDVTDRISDALLTILTDTFTNNPSTVDDLIVPIQTLFDCCGVTGPDDYENITGIGANMTLPEGCCRSLFPGCTLSTGSSTYRTDGCADIVIGIITAYFNVVIGVGIVIFILSVAAIAIPLLLVCAQYCKQEGGLKVV